MTRPAVCARTRLWLCTRGHLSAEEQRSEMRWAGVPAPPLLLFAGVLFASAPDSAVHGGPAALASLRPILTQAQNGLCPKDKNANPSRVSAGPEQARSPGSLSPDHRCSSKRPQRVDWPDSRGGDPRPLGGPPRLGHLRSEVVVALQQRGDSVLQGHGHLLGGLA